MPPLSYSAAILAGGRSSRFGSNKATYLYNGEPLIQHVAESLAGAAERFLVSDESYLGLPNYPDLEPQQGPLGGLHTALHYAQHDWLALAACDLPNLNGEYWSRLEKQLAGQVTLVRSSRGLEPLAAFYHMSVQAAVLTQLEKGELSLRALLARLDTNTVLLNDLGLPETLLLNVNRLNDLDLSS